MEHMEAISRAPKCWRCLYYCRNGAPPRTGCVPNGQMTEVSNNSVRYPPPRHTSVVVMKNSANSERVRVQRRRWSCCRYDRRLLQLPQSVVLAVSIRSENDFPYLHQGNSGPEQTRFTASRPKPCRDSSVWQRWIYLTIRRMGAWRGKHISLPSNTNKWCTIRGICRRLSADCTNCVCYYRCSLSRRHFLHQPVRQTFAFSRWATVRIYFQNNI